MGKKIYCKSCGKFLGEIRDATLYKSIIYLCDRCDNKDTTDNKYDFTEEISKILKG